MIAAYVLRRAGYVALWIICLPLIVSAAVWMIVGLDEDFPHENALWEIVRLNLAWVALALAPFFFAGSVLYWVATGRSVLYA